MGRDARLQALTDKWAQRKQRRKQTAATHDGLKRSDTRREGDEY